MGPLLQLLDKKRTVERVASGGDRLEGPSFDRDGNLWVVEVGGGWLSRVEGGKIVRVAQPAPDARPQATALHRDGRLFVTDRRYGIWTFDPRTKNIELLIPDYRTQPFKGTNDLTFDNSGNLYFTDAWQTGAEDPSGALFLADAASGYKNLTKLIGNLAMPNGVGLTPDGSAIYVAELRQNRNWRCIIDPVSGGIRTSYISTYFLHGFGPDGLKLDDQGNVYQASYGGQGVYVIDPWHEIIEFIQVPEGHNTTNVAFKPGTKWIYITESQKNNVFRVEVDHFGLTPWGLT